MIKLFFYFLFLHFCTVYFVINFFLITDCFSPDYADVIIMLIFLAVLRIENCISCL